MSRILFVDYTPGHDPKALYTKPTGGTLTSLTKVPEYLASKGHEVFVSSMYDKQETINGVTYIGPTSNIGKWDVTVFNRNVLPKDFVDYHKEKGIKMVWWLHDIVDTKYLLDDSYTKIDKVVAMSKYCQDTFSDFYDINESKFTVIPNGIDPAVFYPGKWEDRNPRLFLTASALIKGTMPLVVTFDSLKRLDPEIDFRIYSSQKLHGLANTIEQQNFLKNMELMGAHIYSPMSQQSLAVVMRKAWALLMPNTYPEICSNLLLQARASGLPVVSSNIGANPEFIEHEKTGLLTTKWHPHDIHSWIVEFATQACRLQQDKELHKTISQNTVNNVPTWDSIGEKWNYELRQVIAN